MASLTESPVRVSSPDPDAISPEALRLAASVAEIPDLDEHEPPSAEDRLWWAVECDHVESELDAWLDSGHPDAPFDAADFANDRGGWGGHEAETP